MRPLYYTATLGLLAAATLAPALSSGQTLLQNGLAPQPIGRYVGAPLPRVAPENFPPANFASAFTDLKDGGRTLRLSEATVAVDGDSLRVTGFDRGYNGATLIVQNDYDFAGATATPTDGVSGYRYAFTTTTGGAAFTNVIDGDRRYEGGRQTSATSGIGGQIFTFDFDYDGERLAGYRILDEAGRPTPDSVTYEYTPEGRLSTERDYDEEGVTAVTYTYDGSRLTTATGTGPSDADDYVITYTYTAGRATGAAVTGRARTSTITRTDDGSDANLVTIVEAVDGGATYCTTYGLDPGGSVGVAELPVAPVAIRMANPSRAGAVVQFDGLGDAPLQVALRDASGRIVGSYVLTARTLEMPAVTAGAYVLTVGAEGYAPVVRQVVIQ